MRIWADTPRSIGCISQLRCGCHTLAVARCTWSNATPCRACPWTAQVPPDFIAMLGLQQALTPSRNNGFLNMFKLMQARLRRCG